MPWDRRDFDHYNVPLRFIHRIAEAAADNGDLNLLEDAAAALFRQDVSLDRYKQQGLTREWLAALEGEPAKRVAQLLREDQSAAKLYGELRNAIDPLVRAVLREASNS